MNQHVIAYLLRRYNQLFNYEKRLAIKPEYGGIKTKNWKKLAAAIDRERADFEQRLELEGT